MNLMNKVICKIIIQENYIPNTSKKELKHDTQLILGELAQCEDLKSVLEFCREHGYTNVTKRKIKQVLGD